MNFSAFENVVCNLDPLYDESKVFEHTYLKNIIAQLQNQLGTKFFDFEFEIVFFDLKNHYRRVSPSKKRVVIVIGELADCLEFDDSLIFKTYYQHSRAPSRNVFPFPLGYNGKLDWPEEINQSEKQISVFFSGNLHKGRENMYDFFSGLRFLPFPMKVRLQNFLGRTFDHWYDGGYIRFTNGFATGLSPSQYLQKIVNAKIALCPPGSVKMETFRHYEALRAGCLVVSEQLPETPFFKNSPIIQTDSWPEAHGRIEHLLENLEEYSDLASKSLQWWEEVLSERAVAKYLSRIILEF